MKNSPNELQLINEVIVPAILGGKRYSPLTCDQINIGYNEMACFQAILSNIRPKCSIEIGTATGSTFAILAKYSDHAISIDTDPNVKTNLEKLFGNGEFLTGNSHVVLPDILRKLSLANTPVEFILVDGNHTEDFVRQDIENILTYRPISRLIVMFTTRSIRAVAGEFSRPTGHGIHSVTLSISISLPEFSTRTRKSSAKCGEVWGLRSFSPPSARTDLW